MSIFPIDWQDKENSPQLLAFLQQFGEKAYLSAEEINQIRDALNHLSNLTGVGSGITNDTGFAFVGTNFVINALFTWKFNGTDFVLDDALSIPVPYTTAGKHRTDVIVARNGNIIKLTGLEYNIDVPAPAPTYNQITDLYITQFEVNESGYGTALPTVLGDLYVKKSFSQPFEFTGTGADQVIPLDPLGREEIRLTGSGLTSISGFDLSLITGNPSAEVPYISKPYRLVNLTGGDVALKNSDGSADVIFLAREGADVVIPNLHELEIKFGGGGMAEGFNSWSGGGGSDLVWVGLIDLKDLDYTSNTSEVYLGNAVLPANTLNDTTLYKVDLDFLTQKTGAVTALLINRIYIGNSAGTLTAEVYQHYKNNTAKILRGERRIAYISSGKFGSVSAYYSPTDVGELSQNLGEIALDLTNDLYFNVTTQINNGSETVSPKYAMIKIYKAS